MATVKITRTEFNAAFTAGKLYVDGREFCDTLEDPCRDLNHNGRFDGGEAKIAGDTCIPCGTYKATFASTTVGTGKYAKNGLIPLLHDVPSFTSIRIHSGNTTADTSGCILLGRRDRSGHIADSLNTCLRFYDAVGYEPFTVEIIDKVV